MATTRPETTTTENAGARRGDGDIKRKLALRMGVAAAMIVALLGGLALFDYLSTQSAAPEPVAPQFTEPVPVARKAPGAAAVPAETPRAENQSGASPDKPIPSLEAPPRPEVAAQPALPASSVATPPAGGRSANPPSANASGAARSTPAAQATQGQVKSTPAAAPRSAEPRRPAVAPEPEGSASPPMPTSSAAASEVGERTMPATSSATMAPAVPSPSRLFSGYAVQAGVFSETRRAEELHARLVNAGIPATLETRVQVGPFKTREQAEAARAKLKEMGVDGMLLLPRGAKR